MTTVVAPAKINLALVVGDRRPDGLHEVATLLQRIDIADVLELEEAAELSVDGFVGDTLVRAALTRLAAAAGVEPRWRVAIEKRIPVAAGLGGGSADAGAVLAAVNRSLDDPLPRARLADVAAAVGADVPFFLEPGPKIAEGAGERLTPVAGLPQEYWVVVALARAAAKTSTGDVYRRFDELAACDGFAERRRALHAAVARCRRPRDLAALPENDLRRAADAPEASRLLAALRAAGAFRADLSGAGPAVYGLFEDRRDADAAAGRLAPEAAVWVARPVW